MIIAQEPSPRFAVLPPRSADAPAQAEESGAASSDGFKPFGEDGLSFADLLDVINPLQHLPVISTLYRHWTGDTIDPAPRIAGDALFGGLIGAVVGVANVIAERETGRDFGQHVMAWIGGEPAAENPTAIAALSAEPAARFGVSTEGSLPTPSFAAGRSDRAASWGSPATDITADATPAAPASDAAALAAFAPASGNGVIPPKGQAAFYDDDEAAFAATRSPLFGAGGEMPPDPNDRTAATPLAGATAADGGWFAEAMLTALAKYQQAQALKTTAPGQAAPADLAMPPPSPANAAGAGEPLDL